MSIFVPQVDLITTGNRIHKVKNHQ